MKNPATPNAPADRKAARVARAEPLDGPTQGLDQQTIDRFIAEGDGLMRSLPADNSTEALLRARARALGMTSEFIKKCRLSGSRPAMRVCIRCGVHFLSSGIDNRCCRRCPRS